jgi:cyanate permease
MTMNIGLSSIGPLVAGLAHDQQGNFDSAMWLFIALPLPLALLSCFATPPCRSVAAIVAPTAG